MFCVPFIAFIFYQYTKCVAANTDVLNPSISSQYSSVRRDIPYATERIPPVLNIEKPAQNDQVNIISFLQNVKDPRSKAKGQTEDSKRELNSETFLGFRDKDLLRNAPTAKMLQFFKELNASANQSSKHTTKNTSYLCSERYDEEVFYLRSPNYPMNYPSFTSCEYRIQRKDGGKCGVLFSVLRFDLGPTKDIPGAPCGGTGGDRLLVDGQVFCGRLRRGTEGFFRFNSEVLSMRFQSGAGFGASGFLFKGTQMDQCLPQKPFPSPLQSSLLCDRKVSDRKFTLQSPLYPSGYPPDLECNLEVTQARKDVCGLLLTPTLFDVEGPSSFCAFDYLEVQGKRICGNITSQQPLYYMFETGKLQLRFRTDESVSSRGFAMEGKQINCQDLEYLQPIHSPLIRSERLTDDSRDLSDLSRALSLLVSAGPRQEVAPFREPKAIDGEVNDSQQLSNSGESEKGDEESDDSNSNDDNSIDKMCDEEPCGGNFNDSRGVDTSEINNNTEGFVNIKNTTFEDDFIESDNNSEIASPENNNESSNDSSSSEGEKTLGISGSKEIDEKDDSKDEISKQEPHSFPSQTIFPLAPLQPNLSGSCDEIKSSQVFLIQSINYPNLYPNNLICTYYIQRSSPDICQLRITLEDIDIEKPDSESENCSADYLDIAGYKLCGTYKKSIINVAFTGETVVARFYSDSRISGRGYLLTVEQVSKGCEKRARTEDLKCDSTISHSSFTIFSPGYPYWYPPNLWCTTSLVKAFPNISRIELFFHEFELESSSSCENDYLMVGRRRFCGHRNGNSYVLPFVGDTIPLTFVTDGTSSSRGFQIRIKQLSRSDPDTVANCGGEYFSQRNVLSSPGFPAEYPPNTHCNYVIVRSSPDVCQLQFKIIDLDMQASPGCRRDYLQLGLKRLCGSNLEAQTYFYHFTNEKFIVTFHSSMVASGRGFKVEVSQRSCQKPPVKDPVDPPIDSGVQTQADLFPSGDIGYTAPAPNFGKFPTNIKYCSTGFKRLIRPPLYASRGKHLQAVGNHKIRHESTRHSNEAVKVNNFHPPSLQTINNSGTGSSYEVDGFHGKAVLHDPSACRRCKGLFSENNHYISNYFAQTTPFHSHDIPKDQLTVLRPVLKRDSNREQKSSHKGRTFVWPSSWRVSDVKGQNVKKDGSQASKEGDPIQHNKTDQKLLAFEVPPHKSSSFPSHQNKTSDSDWKYFKDSFLPPKRDSSSPSTGQSTLKTSVPPLPSEAEILDFKRLELQREPPNFLQSVNICNRNISTPSFQLKSPGYPGPFYPNIHCFYNINKHDEGYCGVLINMELLDIPGRPPCDETFLRIAGRRFCGTKEDAIKMVVPFAPKSPVVIEFHSDKFHSGAGFSASIDQVRCNSFPLAPEKQSPRSSRQSSFDGPPPSKTQNSEQDSVHSKERELLPQRSPWRPSNVLHHGRGFVSVPWAGFGRGQSESHSNGLRFVNLAKLYS